MGDLGEELAISKNLKELENGFREDEQGENGKSSKNNKKEDKAWKWRTVLKKINVEKEDKAMMALKITINAGVRKSENFSRRS